MKSPSALWGTRTRRGFRLPERTQRYTHAARHPGYDLIRYELGRGCEADAGGAHYTAFLRRRLHFS